MSDSSSVDTLYIDIMARFDRLEMSMSEAEHAAQRGGERAGEAFSAGFSAKATASSQQFMRILAGLGGGALAAGTSLVKLAGEAEQAQIGFTGLLGSATKAKSFLVELTTFAAQSPFDLKGVQDAARQMLSFGFTSQQVIPSLTAIGDAMSTMGKSTEDINHVVYAFGQMKANGTILKEDMDLLTTSGINGFKLIAEQTGKSEQEIRKMVTAGQLASDVAIPAMLKAFEQQYKGGMDAQAKSLLGLWSTTLDTVQQASTAAGQAIIKGLDLKSALSGLNDFLAGIPAQMKTLDLKQWAKDNEDALLTVGGAITGTLLPALAAGAVAVASFIAPLLLFMAVGAAVALTLKNMGVGLDDVKRVITSVAGSFQQIGQNIQSAAAPSLARLQTVFHEVSATAQEALQRVLMPLFQSLAPVIQAAVSRVMPIAAQLGEMFSAAFRTVVDVWEHILLPVIEQVAPIVQRAIGSVADILRHVIEVVTNIFRLVGDLVKGDWSGAWEAAKGIVGNAVSAIGDALKGIFVTFMGVLQGLSNLIGSKVEELVGAMSNLGKKMVQGFLGAFDSLKSLLLTAISNALSAAADKLPGMAGVLFRQATNYAAGLAKQSAQAAAQHGANIAASNQGPVSGISAPGLVSNEMVDTKTAQRYSYDYISKLKDVFVNDPKVASDCASIASSIMHNLGQNIKGSVNAGVLEQNAIKAGYQRVSGDEIKPGDLVVWTSGNGKTYGAVSGKHVGVGAGMLDGKVMVINNPGSSATQVEQMYDRRNATVYRAPNSPFAQQQQPVTQQPKTNTAPDFNKLFPQGTATTDGPDDIRKKMEAQIKAILAKVDIGLLTKDAAAKLLQKIEADTTATARKQGTGWEDYAATAKTAENAIDSLTKKTKSLSNDALGDLRRQFEYVGKSGLPDYVKGLQALIAQQEKVAASAQKGSKAQKEAMDVVIGARQALEDAQKGKGAAFVTDAGLRQYRAQAEEVIRLEKGLETSTDAAWRQRATNRIQAFQDLPQAAQNVLTFLKNQDQVETQLSDKAKAREKEQTQLRAQVADTKRQLTISAAEGTYNRTVELDRQELAAFKGSAAERLQVVQRQQADEFAARQRVAAATRDAAIRTAQNDTALGASVRDERIRQARATYDQTMLVFKGQQAEQLRTAKEGITKESEAVSGLVEKYRSAREELSKKANAGTLTAGDMDNYAKKLGNLWAEAGKAGIKALPEIQKIHAAAREFADVAIDKNAEAIGRTAGQYGDVADVASRAAASTGLYRASLEDVLALLPEGADQWDAYLTSMAGLDKQGMLAAGVLDSVKDHVQGLRDAIAAAEGEAAGAAALQDVLDNPMAYADGSEAGQAQAAMQQHQKEMAESLQQTLLGLDDATVKNSDSMGVYEEMLNNAGKSGAITDKQLKDLLETLNQLKLAGNPTEDFSQYKDVADGGRGIKPVQGNDFAQQTAYAAELTDQIREQFKGLQLDTHGLTDATSSWNDMLGNMVKTGAISASQEKALLQVIQDIIKGKEKEADEFKKTSEKAEAAGELLAQAQEAIAKASGHAEGPNEDLIKNLEKLRGQAGVSQEALERLITTLKKLDAESAQQKAQDELVAKINKIGDYAQKLVPVVTNAMQALGAATSEEAEQWGQDLGSMVSDLTKFGTQLASHDWAGAAITALSAITGWFSRNKKAAEDAAKATKAYNEQFRFAQSMTATRNAFGIPQANNDDYYGTRTVTKSTSGFLLWSTDHYKEQIDTVKRDLALALEGGFSDGLKSGFENAIAQNDFSAFEKNLKASVGKAVLSGLIESFMQQELLKNTIGPAIKQYLTDHNAATLQTAVAAASAQAQTFYTDVLKPVAAQFDLLGTGDSGGTSTSNSNGSVFGNAPTVQLGEAHVEATIAPEAFKPLTDAFATITPIWESVGKKLDAYLGGNGTATGSATALPAVTVTIPDSILKPLSDFGPAVAIFDQASRRMLDAANVILAAHQGNGMPPKLGGNGGLA